MDNDALGNAADQALLKIHSTYEDLDPMVSPFLRTADAIKVMVLQGLVAPGEPIPSTAMIAQQLGINPMTAIKALKNVADLGIIKSSRGSNYIVCENGSKLCAEIIEGEILTELRYLYRKMTHYLINRSTINQWLKGYEDADSSIKKAKR